MLSVYCNREGPRPRSGGSQSHGELNKRVQSRHVNRVKVSVLLQDR